MSASAPGEVTTIDAFGHFGIDQKSDCFSEVLLKRPIFVLLHCIRRAIMVLYTFYEVLETWKLNLNDSNQLLLLEPYQ